MYMLERIYFKIYLKHEDREKNKDELIIKCVWGKKQYMYKTGSFKLFSDPTMVSLSK